MASPPLPVTPPPPSPTRHGKYRFPPPPPPIRKTNRAKRVIRPLFCSEGLKFNDVHKNVDDTVYRTSSRKVYRTDLFASSWLLYHDVGDDDSWLHVSLDAALLPTYSDDGDNARGHQGGSAKKKKKKKRPVERRLLPRRSQRLMSSSITTN